MKAEKLPRRTSCLVIVVTAIAILSSCGGSGFELAPPERLHGAWQSEPSEEEPEYVRREFTADNAIYEFHDPAYNVHSTINLRTDFAGNWVRDMETQEDYGTDYEILIDRIPHRFWQPLDESTGEIENPYLLEYNVGTMFGRSWDLHMQ